MWAKNWKKIFLNQLKVKRNKYFWETFFYQFELIGSLFELQINQSILAAELILESLSFLLICCQNSIVITNLSPIDLIVLLLNLTKITCVSVIKPIGFDQQLLPLGNSFVKIVSLHANCFLYFRNIKISFNQTPFFSK